ncbi:hypothetical protein QY96_01075 [Bacillus thermotolerans]|uniref:Uncharacterized protein n=1 Tax=Bacillus thermotolerans TaxID=1221996 RepID=A0A0F5HSB0_BACTR|nr:hypothetical protein QY95_03118 [Bacillus thermotolerans]KKB44794.1 hypothetical protein QY96_01075 [Bacillus thermotolerans]
MGFLPKKWMTHLLFMKKVPLVRKKTYFTLINFLKIVNN